MAEPFRIRSLWAPIYLPNFLFSVGRGVTVPVIALLALDLGASPAVAGAVVALRGIGTMLFDLPAGVLIARMGERRTMVASGAALAVVGGLVALRPPLWLYAVLVAVMGCTWSVWHIARISYAAESAAVQYRGRVMAAIGGSTRIGLLIGPLLGSVVMSVLGLTGAFVVLAAVAAAGSLSMAMSRPALPSSTTPKTASPPTIAEVWRRHRRVFATAGSVAVAAQVLRSSREVLIPLWGDSIGMTASSIQLIFAASYALESLAFYPVGMLMDRKGRKWAIAPCLALLSIGTVLIPAASTAARLTGVAMLIGLANGLGTGLNMTLGSDFSPVAGRSRFLGVWRLITDLGTAGGPLLIAGITSAAALATAAWAVGGVGLAGLLVLWRLVPETLAAEEP